MFSQNIAKITPPSHFYFRTQLPLQQAINQWKAVYYFSGLNNRVRRGLALQEKAALVDATRVYEGKKSILLAADEKMQQQGVIGATTGASSSNAATATKVADVLAHIEALNEYGFTDISYPYVQHLHSKGLLNSPADYATIIRSYRCEGVRKHLLSTTAKWDKVASLKAIADHRAAERAGESHRVLEMAHERFGAGSGFSAESEHSLTACYNAYMETMLTCGYDGMKAVANQIYDQMGNLNITPTMSTYESVVLALALTGEMAEAEQVANFVITRGFPAATAAASASSSDALTAQKLLPIYNALMMGYRENKMHDKCDMLWKELVENRCPRPNAVTADLYIRSIIDLSYTRTADTHSKFVEMNIVEKKRIPLVLAQMDELGIPRTHLTTPVHHEVEDALRKFSIGKHRFYNWGRAVKQFNFVEFRRKNGWLYGMDEMMPVNIHDPVSKRLPWQTNSDSPVVGIGRQTVPDHIFGEHRPWLEAPLQSIMNRIDTKERYDDTRAAEYFYKDQVPVHDRSASWTADVPQTRYDQFYGLSRPAIHRSGIRRHLAAEWADGVLGGEERSARDDAVLKSITNTARRSRYRAEVHNTHRVSPVDV